MDLALVALMLGSTLGVALVLGLCWVLADAWDGVVMGAQRAAGDEPGWGAGVDIDAEWAEVAEAWSRS